MLASQTWKPRGILNLKAGEKKFQLSQHGPSPDLRFFVDYYWIVSWDLRGQEPYLSENLPHPSVHLVFERGRSRVVGVVKGKFTQLLEDKDRVFGIKFRPGAFYPFVEFPISRFTNRSLSFQEVFGLYGDDLEDLLLSEEDESAMVELAENFLRTRLPAERDENIERINQIIERVIAEREIMTVDDLAERFSLSKRTLQRLFHKYVGVNPKWVIQRYRLHEATDQLDSGCSLDWAKLAQDLGYFDQAHFIKDFKALIGCTPAEYVRRIAQDDQT